MSNCQNKVFGYLRFSLSAKQLLQLLLFLFLLPNVPLLCRFPFAVHCCSCPASGLAILRFSSTRVWYLPDALSTLFFCVGRTTDVAHARVYAEKRKNVTSNCFHLCSVSTPSSSLPHSRPLPLCLTTTACYRPGFLYRQSFLLRRSATCLRLSGSGCGSRRIITPLSPSLTSLIRRRRLSIPRIFPGRRSNLHGAFLFPPVPFFSSTTCPATTHSRLYPTANVNKRTSLSSTKTDLILSALKELTLAETAELVKQIEASFGVSSTFAPLTSVTSASPQTAPRADGGQNKDDEQDEEDIKPVEIQTHFDVSVQKVDAIKRIAVIKVIKQLTDKTLKESKDVVDNLPQVLKTKLPKEEADDLKTKLEEAGAQVLIQ